MKPTVRGGPGLRRFRAGLLAGLLGVVGLGLVVNAGVAVHHPEGRIGQGEKDRGYADQG